MVNILSLTKLAVSIVQLKIQLVIQPWFSSHFCWKLTSEAPQAAIKKNKTLYKQKTRSRSHLQEQGLLGGIVQCMVLQ